MKRGTFLAVAHLLAVVVGMSVQAHAQSISSADTLLQRGDNRGELVLAVGGQQITLGSASSQKVHVRGMVEVQNRAVKIGLGAVEFGFSLLASVDYGAYLPEEQGFLDQRVGKSIHVGFRPLDLEFRLNRAATLSLVTGISFSVDNYRLDNAWSLAKVDGRIEPLLLEGMKKSKFTTAQFGLPIGVKYCPARKVEFTAFAFGEVVYNAHTKVAKPKDKARLHGVNDLRFGVQATATYRNVGLYIKYSLTPMFRSGVGPKCYPLSVGLAWGF